jgi:YVTN family beta-propeller protein
VAEVATGFEPEGVVVDEVRRRAFVACARSDRSASWISFGVRSSPKLRSAGSRWTSRFDDATGRIFTADLLGETVSVLDGSTLGLFAVVPVGSYPSGLALDARRRRTAGARSRRPWW